MKDMAVDSIGDRTVAGGKGKTDGNANGGICQKGYGAGHEEYVGRVPIWSLKQECVPGIGPGEDKWLYITDNGDAARRLRDQGEAVLIWLHEDNGDQDFSGFYYAVTEPEELEEEFLERVYRRQKGLPWQILETARCLVRETVPEDVEAFYQIYSHPAITRHMEGLYPDVEQEKQYIREYIKKVYTYYEYGVWTVLEKGTGMVVGRAGFACREGYEEPELGFVIGVPWQHKGYAGEVCRAVLAYGFGRLDFEQVQAMVEPGNAASFHLCQRLGFQKAEQVVLGGREYQRLVLAREGGRKLLNASGNL